MQNPVCVVCFYERNGVFPPSLIFHDLESALTIVSIRKSEVQCVSMEGGIVSSNEKFKNREAYMNKLNVYQDKVKRAIVCRVMGPYRRS